MSIVSQIDRISNNIADTYSVLESAGATMPAEANSDNLAATAQTISAVLYGKAQSLTEAQKAQARDNIGAASETQMEAVNERLDALVGTDEGKSVRQIATEVVGGSGGGSLGEVIFSDDGSGNVTIMVGGVALLLTDDGAGNVIMEVA